MIDDKQMKFIKSENGLDFYIFTPTLFRQYFNKNENWTVHRKSIMHKLHMFLYYIRGGYRILYMIDGDKIAAYVIYAKCGKTVIKNSTRDDIFTVFVTTHPDYRRKGIATAIINEMLHGIGLQYNNAYKTIEDSNIGSKKVAFANGYAQLYKAKRSKILKTISKSDVGNWRLYSLQK